MSIQGEKRGSTQRQWLTDDVTSLRSVPYSLLLLTSDEPKTSDTPAQMWICPTLAITDVVEGDP